MNQISITYVEDGLYYSAFVVLPEDYKRIPLNGFNRWIEALWLKRKCIEVLADGYGDSKRFCCLGVASECQGRLTLSYGSWIDGGDRISSGLRANNPMFTDEYMKSFVKRIRPVDFLPIPETVKVFVLGHKRVNNKLNVFEEKDTMAAVNDEIDCEFFDPIILILELIFCDSTQTE